EEGFAVVVISSLSAGDHGALSPLVMPIVFAYIGKTTRRMIHAPIPFQLRRECATLERAAGDALWRRHRSSGRTDQGSRPVSRLGPDASRRSGNLRCGCRICAPLRRCRTVAQSVDPAASGHAALNRDRKSNSAPLLFQPPPASGGIESTARLAARKRGSCL